MVKKKITNLKGSESTIILMNMKKRLIVNKYSPAKSSYKKKHISSGKRVIKLLQNLSFKTIRQVNKYLNFICKWTEITIIAEYGKYDKKRKNIK